MSTWFSIEVRFLAGRYHGRDANAEAEWPPSSLRLFQAIVAGSLSGRWALEERSRTEAVLRWLEALGAPQATFAVRQERKPYSRATMESCEFDSALRMRQARKLRPYRLAVPNNQADSYVSALREGVSLDRLLARDKELKDVRPWMVGRLPVIYAWKLDGRDRPDAEMVRSVVRRLVVLGTGLDHAVADIRVTDECPIVDNLVQFPLGLAPCVGTLDSLIARHQAELNRLKTGNLRENRPPVCYAAAVSPLKDAVHLIFAFREGERGRHAIDPKAAAILAQALRGILAERLVKALRSHPEIGLAAPEEVERFVTGRGADASDISRRLHIAPLPSIGGPHADGLLRRVLVSVPNDFPITPDSIRRALTNQEFEIELTPSHRLSLRLVPVDPMDTKEQTMRERYLDASCVWRSLSPVLLPGRYSKGFVSNVALSEEKKAILKAQADEERCLQEYRFFMRALVHAGLHVARFRLRRESFNPHQPSATADWQLPRNGEGRTWLAGRPRVHAEIDFDQPQKGPILIGDGRFLGLGLFAVSSALMG